MEKVDINILDYDHFEAIYLKNDYGYPPDNIYHVEYSLTINKDGCIEETDLENHDDHFYKASKKDVKELYYKLIAFLNDVEGNEIMFDMAYNLVIEYKDMSIKTNQYAYNKNHQFISQIIDDFMEKKAKESLQD